MPNIDIDDNDARIQYTATASQTAFTYDFVIFSDDDIKVVQNGTVLTKTTDYTVSGVENESGGTVTLTTGATAGDTITLYRDSVIERTSQYQVDGILDAEPLERDMDRIFTILQEQDRTLGRAFTIDIESSVSQISVPVSANELIGWNAAGDELTTYAFSNILDEFDTVITSLSANDLLQYDGTNWINRSVPEFTNVNAASSAGGNLRTSGGANCLSWGGGGSANLTLGGNMSGGGTYKLVNMVDPTAAQDYATKAYVDAQSNGGWVPLQTQTVSSPVASVDFTSNIDSTYKAYAIVFTGVRPATDSVSFEARTGNGGSFDAGTGYSWGYDRYEQSGIFTESNGSNASRVVIAGTNIGNNAPGGEGLSGVLEIYNIADSAWETDFRFRGVYRNVGGNPQGFDGFGSRNEVAAHDRLQFLFSSGNIESGTFTLYGLAGA